MSRGTTYRQLFLSSDQAAFTTASGSYIWTWPQGFVLGDRHSACRVSVLNFICYNLSYNVSTGISDTLNCTIGGTSKSLTLSQGQYSTDTLVTAINSGITGLTCSYASSTNQFTFTSSSSLSLNASSNILSVLGFDASTTATATLSSSIYYLTSSHNVNMGGNTRYDIQSSLATLNGYNNRLDSGVVFLCRVPVNVFWGQPVVYQPTSQVWSLIQDHSIQYLAIRVLDCNGNPVTFSNVPFSLTLYFESDPMPPPTDAPDPGADSFLSYNQTDSA